jgi:hypothetical protein
MEYTHNENIASAGSRDLSKRNTAISKPYSLSLLEEHAMKTTHKFYNIFGTTFLVYQNYFNY